MNEDRGAFFLVRGATLVDGSGAEPYPADVWVRQGIISKIGEPGSADEAHDQGFEVVEADGLVLAPGFIDMHAHADLSLISGADADAKLLQGVTTQVIGQDGLGYAPVDEGTRQMIGKQIAGWNGPLPDGADWSTMAQYLEVLDQGMPTNAVVLTPHGNLRMMVMGNEERPATDQELARMCALLDQAMREGSAGLSTGLTYTPAMYANTDELIALCEVVAAHGGYFSPHTRSYGKGALESYAEMVEVARRSGVLLHLTHATMNFPENEGRAGDLLDLAAAARAQGITVSLDTYPYTAGATTLSALLPSWAFEGGPERLLERLRDPSSRREMIRQMDELGSDGAHGTVVDWSAQQIAGVGTASLEPVVGLTVDQIHRSGALRQILGPDATEGETPATTALDLMAADGLATTILMHVGHESNIAEMLSDPYHCAGSDGITHGSKPHPRAWGTFARYLGHYSRELGLMGLSEAVNHMTKRPADVLGLATRGLVQQGFVADLVLFDPATIADRATYDEPKLSAVGVHHVWIAGGMAVRDGAVVNERLGRVLR